MVRRVYVLEAEPRRQTYTKLLVAALSACDQFLFVDVPGPHFGENDSEFGSRSRALVQELEAHLISVTKSDSWPGTHLVKAEGYEPYGRIYRYHFNVDSARVLSRVADGLYEWRFPHLPADLCLIRSDGDPWLVNMPADEEAYLSLTESEANDLRAAVPELELGRDYEH